MPLIEYFTFDRNAFLRNQELSADLAIEIIKKVNSKALLDKTDSNKVGAFASYMGLFKKSGVNYESTELANSFIKLYNQSKVDAWQWLVTRSLWLYVVPNGTRSNINPIAISAGVSVSLFELLLGILIHLQTLKGSDRFLYYDEFCEIFNDDANWKLRSFELFEKILQARNGSVDPNQKLALLGALEDVYNIPRDNFNAFFNKN